MKKIDNLIQPLGSNYTGDSAIDKEREPFAESLQTFADSHGVFAELRQPVEAAREPVEKGRAIRRHRLLIKKKNQAR